jgi:hypothetical protein
MSNARYVFALSTTVLSRPERHTVHVGEAWWADHPVVLANPSAFGDTPPEVFPRGWEPAVEQATSAPGERRSTRRG